ncbi:N-acetylmuramoyl-L-alanine amidase [Panacagrimonas perspica]|uniref:N-acetylmuramoyl-L-alanine amidase AmiC n=1 Tax=Panacagrimonas perspica TaxID=381431 RepID=A0A4R7NU06_9GAMM|nr:N-acetylmuramoyl-L-alanine amidase [Panacagrimonas perspica]TDU24418.1 N-acetylmuramoyl-L-alanine amidase [Panacagrimonas perspica]THD01484.1 N-acetylmuramoyl-L-alanine amidase [Panacagrimonas perspica]
MRFLVFLLLTGAASLATAGELRDLRLWDSPEGTRVVLELSGSTAHKVFALENPSRIVIDLPGTTGVRLANKAAGKGAVEHVRAAQREEGLRIVLDMRKSIEPRAFLLDPADQYGYRLVLDLAGAGDEGAAPAAPPVKAEAWEPKPIVVAIDAGHGGEDPGAIGHGGLFEKDVALTLARKLAALVNAEPGFRAVLTRDGDYYLELRERVKRARKAQADLFVSVHANALKDRNMRGSAVYVVSARGATSEHARWLAQKENAADLVGGVGLHGKDDELAAVLIDLSQASTMEASFDVGARMLKSLGRVNTLQRAQVQQAGFMVLKAPDIPSVLVETAFITNAEEERLLRDPKGQDRIARSLFDGIKGYFESYRPREQRPADSPSPRLQKVRAPSGDGVRAIAD